MVPIVVMPGDAALRAPAVITMVAWRALADRAMPKSMMIA